MLLAAAGIVSGQDSVQVMSSNGTQYVAISSEMTLYYFAKDATRTSNYAGACAKFWPPFQEASLPPAGS